MQAKRQEQKSPRLDFDFASHQPPVIPNVCRLRSAIHNIIVQGCCYNCRGLDSHSFSCTHFKIAQTRIQFHSSSRDPPARNLCPLRNRHGVLERLQLTDLNMRNLRTAWGTSVRELLQKTQVALGIRLSTLGFLYKPLQKCQKERRKEEKLF